ncbi:unnamed protein product [Eruca vesicaria subsp. sativa]|uniref:Secreted protein n=1 Tax=Eruca vesicaria subsp. sativa TaxID=29727 RepID=A0ABC8K6G0_ERUVS|nr:unnamed protein product [Eruca vesicaria subsp. sativa]
MDLFTVLLIVLVMASTVVFSLTCAGDLDDYLNTEVSPRARPKGYATIRVLLSALRPLIVCSTRSAGMSRS